MFNFKTNRRINVFKVSMSVYTYIVIITPVTFICNLYILYTSKISTHKLTNPLQFPHKPPGVREPQFGKPWRTV